MKHRVAAGGCNHRSGIGQLEAYLVVGAQVNSLGIQCGADAVGQVHTGNLQTVLTCIGQGKYLTVNLLADIYLLEIIAIH